VKFIYLPIGVIGGLVSGLVGKNIFERLWGAIGGEEPPDPKYREVDYGKLAAALLLEGAIFGFIRGFFDHAARRAFQHLTSTWPGEEAPKPE
jgi:hypothetical protein